MDDQELVRRITSLQARINRMESMMQQLLSILTASGATSTGEQTQMRNMLQELRRDSESQAMERPEMVAICQALLVGDKMKAIRLYRSVYGVGLKEAQDALDAM